MMWNDNFVWVETLKYVKCPVCGKVAVIDTGKILTSMPPKYQWHCKHCNGYGYILCNETDKFEPVIPTQEDKDLYDPQPKFESESVIINGPDDGKCYIDLNDSKLEHASTVGELTITIPCEICDKPFNAGSAISTNFSAPPKHICPECREKLKKLLNIVK